MRQTVQSLLHHELRKAQEGSVKQGQRRDLTLPHCGKALGQSLKDTAKELSMSFQALHKSLQIAEAIEKRPELARKPGLQILLEIRREKLKVQPLPYGRFRTIVADPPWALDRAEVVEVQSLPHQTILSNASSLVGKIQVS